MDSHKPLRFKTFVMIVIMVMLMIIVMMMVRCMMRMRRAHQPENADRQPDREQSDRKGKPRFSLVEHQPVAEKKPKRGQHPHHQRMPDRRGAAQ